MVSNEAELRSELPKQLDRHSQVGSGPLKSNDMQWNNTARAAALCSARELACLASPQLEFVHFEHLQSREQLALVLSARVLAGLHGQALAYTALLNGGGRRDQIRDDSPNTI